MHIIRRRFLLFSAALFLQLSIDAHAQFRCRSLFSSSSQIRTVQEVQQLVIGSYNVENLFVSAGKFDRVDFVEMAARPDRPKDIKSPAQVAELRKVIQEMNADIFVLSEVENLHALETLASSTLQGKYRSFLIEGNDPRGIDIGFLVKTDLPFDVVHKSNKDLRFTDPKTNKTGPLFSRDLPILEFRVDRKSTNPLFIIVGNHAKSKRDMPGDPESKRWRSAQYEKAAEIVRGYTARRIPVFFAGDFNADLRFDTEVEPLKRILKSSLATAPNSLPENLRITHTYHPQNGPTKYSQLDDVLVSPELPVLSATIIRYHDSNGKELPLPQTFDDRAKQPSDHFPVLTTIDVRRLTGGKP